jgi:hypothetical protein
MQSALVVNLLDEARKILNDIFERFVWHCHGAAGLQHSRWPGSPTRMSKVSYSGYRFPPEIIHQAIWLYLRFTLSLRDVEDLLAERGVTVSYETVRRWVNHFGPMIAADLRKRRLKRLTSPKTEAALGRLLEAGAARIADLFEVRQGVRTGDNKAFLIDRAGLEMRPSLSLTKRA